MSILKYLLEDLDSTELSDTLQPIWDSMLDTAPLYTFPDEFYSISPDEQKEIMQKRKELIASEQEQEVSDDSPTQSKNKLHMSFDDFRGGSRNGLSAMRAFVDHYEKKGGDADYFDDETNNNYNKFKRTIAMQEG